jgi:hypothetical protein
MILGSKPVPLASADFLYVLTERPLRLLESLDALGEGLQPRARDTAHIRHNPSPPVVMLPRSKAGTIVFAPCWHKDAVTSVKLVEIRD